MISLFVDISIETASQSTIDQSAKIFTLVDTLKGLQEQIVTVAPVAAKDCQNADRMRELFTALTSASERYMELETLSDLVAFADIRSGISSLSEHNNAYSVIAKLMSGSKGPREVYSLLAEEFRGDVEVLKTALEHAASISADEKGYVALKRTQKELEDAAQQMVTTGKAVAANPSDPNTAEHFNILVRNWEEKVKEMEIHMNVDEQLFATVDLVAADSKSSGRQWIILTSIVMALSARFREAAVAGKNRTAESYSIATLAICTTVERLMALAQRQMERCEDPKYKATLAERMASLSTGISTVGDEVIVRHNRSLALQSFRKEVEAPEFNEDRFHQQERNLMENISALQSVIVQQVGAKARHGIIIPVPSVVAPKATVQSVPQMAVIASGVHIIDGEEIEVIQGSAPQPLSQEEAIQNPIKASG